MAFGIFDIFFASNSSYPCSLGLQVSNRKTSASERLVGFPSLLAAKAACGEKHHTNTSLKTNEFPLKIDSVGSNDSFPFRKVPLFRGNSFIFGEVNLGENNDENQLHEPLQILYVASPIPPSSFEEDRPCHQWDGWSIGKGT